MESGFGCEKDTKYGYPEVIGFLLYGWSLGSYGTAYNLNKGGFFLT
jgi:hypothetical protein